MTGDWRLVTRIPRNVIPSVAEGSLLHCDNQHVCTEGKRWLGAASYATMSALPYRFLGYARNDDGAKRYQNSAALLIFMRRTTTLNPEP